MKKPKTEQDEDAELTAEKDGGDDESKKGSLNAKEEPEKSQSGNVKDEQQSPDGSDCSFLFTFPDRPPSAQPTEPSATTVSQLQPPPRYSTPEFFALSRSPAHSYKSPNEAPLPFWTDPAAALFGFSRESPFRAAFSSFSSSMTGIPLQRLVTPPPLLPPNVSSATSSASSSFRVSDNFFEGFLKGEQQISPKESSKLKLTATSDKSSSDSMTTAE
jgi:hypothetical protein